MSYDTRWDPSANFTMLGVVAHSQPYLKGGTAFDANTSPTLTQVEQFIGRNVVKVVATLSRNGYSATQTVADVTTLLSDAVIYGTLMEIEFGKTNAVTQRGESSRWSMYKGNFEEILKMLEGPTMEYIGATLTRRASNGLEFTGRTWTTQDDVMLDTAEKGPLFPRGFMEGNLPGGRSSLVELAEPTTP